jgi:hypothetical protein
MKAYAAAIDAWARSVLCVRESPTPKLALTAPEQAWHYLPMLAAVLGLVQLVEVTACPLCCCWPEVGWHVTMQVAIMLQSAWPRSW